MVRQNLRVDATHGRLGDLEGGRDGGGAAGGYDLRHCFRVSRRPAHRRLAFKRPQCDGVGPDLTRVLNYSTPEPLNDTRSGPTIESPAAAPT